MDSHSWAGFGLAAISFFFRYAVKDMPRPIAWLGVLFGISVMVASITPATSKYINGPLIMFAVGCFCILGSGLWFYLGGFSPAAQAQTAPASSVGNSVNQQGGITGGTVIINPPPAKKRPTIPIL